MVSMRVNNEIKIGNGGVVINESFRSTDEAI